KPLEACMTAIGGISDVYIDEQADLATTFDGTSFWKRCYDDCIADCQPGMLSGVRCSRCVHVHSLNHRYSLVGCALSLARSQTCASTSTDVCGILYRDGCGTLQIAGRKFFVEKNGRFASSRDVSV